MPGPIASAVISAENGKFPDVADWRYHLYQKGSWQWQYAIVQHDIQVESDNKVSGCILED